MLSRGWQRDFVRFALLGRARESVFKTAAFNRSATPPFRSLQGAQWKEQLGIAPMDLDGVKRKWEIEKRKEKLEKERTGESRKDRGISWEEGARGVREQGRG